MARPLECRVSDGAKRLSRLLYLKPRAAVGALSRRRPAEPDLSDPALYMNRELSWLAFNGRVLAQARDSSQPLLERVKFLAIAANNLDEFHMVGLASLLRQFRSGVETVSPDGLEIEERVETVRK